VSRCTDPASFCCVGVPPLDLLEDVSATLRAVGVDVEAWLRRAVSVTGDWVLEPTERHHRGPAPLGDRLRARYQPANLPPVVLKSLLDILNPMPKALVVIENLLAYFDHADLASQLGIPRPPFLTADGRPIFPEDEPWWLTELSERKKAATEQPGDDEEAAGPGDEDGPASADERPAGAGHMSDSDPDSEGEPPADDKPGLGRDPKLAWLERRRRREAAAASATAAKVEASTPRPNDASSPPRSPLQAAPAPAAEQYRGFFERQVAGRCGMHALNNALGFAFAGEEDLVFACDEWLRASHHEGLPEVRARHMNAHGWYSIEVMSAFNMSCASSRCGSVPKFSRWPSALW